MKTKNLIRVSSDYLTMQKKDKIHIDPAMPSSHQYSIFAETELEVYCPLYFSALISTPFDDCLFICTNYHIQPTDCESKIEIL